MATTGIVTATQINLNGDLDVDGHTELDNLNVSGVSTFVGVATFSTNDVYVAQRLFVGGVEVGGTTNTFAGINTFTDTTDNTLGNSNTGAVQLDGGLGVDKNVTIGAGLSVAGNAGIGSLNVAGVSTFVGLLTVTSGDVYIAQRLFVGGLEVEGSGSENTFTGINTFTNQADNTLGDTNTGSLQGNGGLGIDKNASFGDKVFVQNAIGINSTVPIGQFDVNGHTELDDVNVSGAITATTFTGNLAGTATIAEYTSEWNITSNGSSDYRFTGPGFDGTENDPTIYLTRGEEYKFTNNMGAHPFQIRTAINGSAYNDGITNNGVSNGTLTWDVQMDAPNVLYYQCTAHAGMVGKIYIGNSGSSIDIDGHIETDTLNVSGLSTFTGAADFNGNVDIDGHTELDNLNVSGVSTFAGAIDANGNLDVDGHTELDDLNVSGVSTFTGAIDANGNLDVDGHTELDDLNVSGVSTFAGAIDANGNLDVDGHTELDDLNVSGVSTFANGLVANSAQISDLTSGRVVLAGTGGELEDNSKLTFNGTTLTVAGDASFNGNVTIGGTLTSEDKTNVDSIGLVTARSGVRISAGGLVVTSGVSTFTDNIIGNLTGTATTATNLAGGDTGDIPYQSANGTTTFVDATGVGAGLVLMWGGSNPIWSPVSGASGNFGGITLLEEGAVVGSAGSVTGLNFVGNNVTATAPSGIANGVVTLSDTPTFDSLKVTGISTIPNVSGVTTFSDNVNVGTGITFYASSGIISATKFFGSGENLTDLINQRIEGIRILDEGVQVGSGTTFTNLNFVGNGVVATGIGTTGIITITDTTFEADAQQNLYAGTDAGAASDADTLRNIAIGCKSGCSLNEGDDNVFLGTSSGACVTSGSCNVFLGFDAGKFTTCGSSNIAIGPSAGYNSPGGDNNVFLGIGAGRQVSTGENNIFLGQNSGGQNASAPTTGINNISLGRSSGSCLTDGADNIFLGKYAGTKTTGGDTNVFLGKYAGCSNTGDDNIYMGCQAGRCATGGDDNIFLGRQAAGTGAVTGCHNVAFGFQAGNSLTAGCDNIFIGKEAGSESTTCCGSVLIGSEAGKNNDASYNVFLGMKAGRGSSTPSDNTGGCNVFLGLCAGYSFTSGADNIAIGENAGKGITSGCDNIILGQSAGEGNTTGCYNIFFGKLTAGQTTVTGGCNIAMGRCAGYKLTSGCDNVFLGYDAGYNSAAAGKNVFIGQQAGCTNTSGDSNIAIGCQVSLPSATGDKQLAIGNGSDRWIAGDSSFNVTVSTASTFSNDGLNVTGVVTATDFNATSDARLKTNVQVIPDPLDKIVRIDGVSFNWIKDNKPSMGVIADNIQEVLPDLVSDGDPKTVNYNGLIGLLIEVVKDQQTQINSLNERLSRLE